MVFDNFLYIFIFSVIKFSFKYWNILATHAGLGIVNSENVFKVCDEPHPLMLSKMPDHCIEGQIDEAVAVVTKLFNYGYASEDIIQNIFKWVFVFLWIGFY